MTNCEEEIHIVTFTTNDKSHSSIDIIQILLDQYNHTIIKKSSHAIALKMVLAKRKKPTKIMLCEILNLTKEYPGIMDVNCYLIFIDLENDKSKESLDLIISFLKRYGDLTKMIYILGIVNNNKISKQIINKNDINKIMLFENLYFYEFIESCLEKKVEVSKSLLNIFIKCIKEGNEKEKNNNQAHSCNSCNVY